MTKSSDGTIINSKMVKNILVVSDKFTGGGLETRILGQINELKKMNINVHIVCSEFNEIFRDYFSSVHIINLYPENNAITVGALKEKSNIIKEICKEYKIDFIDCHPFWSPFFVSVISFETKIPFSYTLHGVPSLGFINYDNTSGRMLYDLMIKEGADHLISVAEYIPRLNEGLARRSKIIRNTIECHDAVEIIEDKNKKWALVSRLDDIKGDLVIDFLSKAKRIGIKRIDIFGDGNKKEEINDYINKHNIKGVKVLGWANNVVDRISNGEYFGVIGMGRVILEAMSINLPAVILGYGGLAGVVCEKNFNHFMEQNFTSWDFIDDDSMEDEVRSLYNNPENYLMRKAVAKKLNPKDSWKKYVSIINDSSTNNNANFSKIIEKILTLKDEENILSNKNIVESILVITSKSDNYNEIRKQWLNGVCDELMEVKEEKRIIDAKNELLKNDNNKKDIIREKELQDILNSTSWRVTKPIRMVKDFYSRMMEKIRR